MLFVVRVQGDLLCINRSEKVDTQLSGIMTSLGFLWITLNFIVKNICIYVYTVKPLLVNTPP